MKTKVCESCDYVGKPKPDEYSSFSIDAMLWLAWMDCRYHWYLPVILVAPVFSLIHIAKFQLIKHPKC